MKETDFYQRTIDDAAFRRQQLDNLRYIKSISAWLSGISAAMVVGLTVWHGARTGEWDRGLDSISVAIFTAMSYALIASRLGALEAIERTALRRLS